MLVASNGIVLHQIKHSDQQNIIRIYTRQFGMLSMLVPASRRKGATRMVFQPMLPVDAHFQLRENRTLCRLQEMHILHPLHQIRSSPVKTAQMLFLAEIILKAIREEEQNDALFDFILNSILLLDQHETEIPDFHLKFILDLSRFLGFYPADNFNEQTVWFSISEGAFMKQNQEFCLNISLSQSLVALLRSSYQELENLPFNGFIRRSLLQAILQYYQWHLSSVRDLKTPAVLEEVFR